MSYHLIGMLVGTCLPMTLVIVFFCCAVPNLAISPISDATSMAEDVSIPVMPVRICAYCSLVLVYVIPHLHLTTTCIDLIIGTNQEVT